MKIKGGLLRYHLNISYQRIFSLFFFLFFLFLFFIWNYYFFTLFVHFGQISSLPNTEKFLY